MRLFPHWDRWESASWITSTTGSFLRASISQIRAPQPLRVPRTKGPFCQECAVPQPTNLIPGKSYRLSPNEGGSHARTCTGHSAAQRVSQTPPWQGESGLHCSSGSVEEPSVDGTDGWGVPLSMVCSWKVISTDASNLGWGGGVLCDGKPAFGLWSKKEGYLHINCVEMLAVCLGLSTFLPDLRGHHVLVCHV